MEPSVCGDVADSDSDPNDFRPAFHGPPSLFTERALGPSEELDQWGTLRAMRPVTAFVVIGLLGLIIAAFIIQIVTQSP